MIKVLVVDDSKVVRDFFVHLLSKDPQIESVAVASDGAEAIATVRTLKPDIITMDLHMPRVSGVQAIRQIMQSDPTPIVVVTDLAPDLRATIEAFEAGAVTVLPRPPGFGDPGYDAACAKFVETVKLMAEVKVVRRFNRNRGPKAPVPWDAKGFGPRALRLVVIGASTGGPAVLQFILCGLPRDFPVPILIVQHIATGFVNGFVAWLCDSCSRQVRIAQADEVLQPGVAYVAPDRMHIGVTSKNRVVLSAEAKTNRIVPSASHLFHSVAVAHGANAVGILLTGMGRDGADGLAAMHAAGALTIAQDPETCVVAGMPEEAIRLGAATVVATPEKIIETLASLVAPAMP